MISVEQTQTLYLGRVGEQNVEPLPFDIAPWIAKYGQGVTVLTVKRACDSVPYPVDIVTKGNVVTWTVSKKDVESYGTGRAELTYMVDDKIKKSVVYKTFTEKSLADITPTPEDGQTWLDAMTKQVLKAEGQAVQSESYAHGGTGTRVDEDTDNAQYYKEQANLDAQTTDADRQVVEQAKTEVLESVKEVGLNKQAVENVAKNVTDAETRIGKAESDIKLMQTDVQTNKDAVDTAKQAVDASQLDVTNKAEQVTKDAQQVATDKGIVEQAKTDIGNKIQEHNVSPLSHADIRGLIEGLTTRLNALADSDDESLDQLSEIVAYIKSNKSLIENVTTNKVNVADIIDNLNTNVPNKPLSASMGVELKRLIDAIKVPTKVSELTNDSGYLTEHQDISGKVDKAVQEKKDAEQDKAIKKNADDVLKCVKKTDIDAEMSDVSENPVQNKVVKQYVDKHSGGGNVVGKPYELIEKIIVQEDMAVNRDNLNLTNLQLWVKYPKEGVKGNKGFWVRNEKNETINFITFTPTTSKYAYLAKVDIKNGYADSIFVYGNKYGNSEIYNESVIYKTWFLPSKIINSIRSYMTVPAGTEIEIYGVRA